MSLEVEVDSAEVRTIPREGKNDLLIQDAYYHDGGKYPVRIEMVHTDQAEVLPVGRYEIGPECLGNDRNGRFNLVFGWPQKLRRIDKSKAAA